MKRILIATTALLGVMVGQNAWASSPATASMRVSASLGASCTVTAARMAFRTITTGVAATGSSSISVNCTSGADYEIGMDNGTNFASGTRNLVGTASASNTVAYNVYSDSGYTTTWGTTIGTDTVEGTGNGAAQVIPVYVKIPSGQTVAADTYTDSLGVTVTY